MGIGTDICVQECSLGRRSGGTRWTQTRQQGGRQRVGEAARQGPGLPGITASGVATARVMRLHLDPSHRVTPSLSQLRNLSLTLKAKSDQLYKMTKESPSLPIPEAEEWHLRNSIPIGTLLL